MRELIGARAGCGADFGGKRQGRRPPRHNPLNIGVGSGVFAADGAVAGRVFREGPNIASAPDRSVVVFHVIPGVVARKPRLVGSFEKIGPVFRGVCSKSFHGGGSNFLESVACLRIWPECVPLSNEHF